MTDEWGVEVYDVRGVKIFDQTMITARKVADHPETLNSSLSPFDLPDDVNTSSYAILYYPYYVNVSSPQYRWGEYLFAALKAQAYISGDQLIIDSGGTDWYKNYSRADVTSFPSPYYDDTGSLTLVSSSGGSTQSAAVFLVANG